MSLLNAVQEAVWLRLLLKDMKCFQNRATTIYQYNQGCVALAKNPIYHARIKHIDIKYHFLREKVESKVVELEYRSTEGMVADGLTKELANDKHSKFVASLKLNK